MTTTISTFDNGDTAILTTEHAASSYGMPVLVVGGIAYGPGDQVTYSQGPDDPFGEISEPAQTMVAAAAVRGGKSDDILVQKFLMQEETEGEKSERRAWERSLQY